MGKTGEELRRRCNCKCYAESMRKVCECAIAVSSTSNDDESLPPFLTTSPLRMIPGSYADHTLSIQLGCPPSTSYPEIPSFYTYDTTLVPFSYLAGILRSLTSLSRRPLVNLTLGTGSVSSVSNSKSQFKCRSNSHIFTWKIKKWNDQRSKEDLQIEWRGHGQRTWEKRAINSLAY